MTAISTNGSPAEQHETPHGIIRTALQPTDNQHAHIAIEYDDDFLVFVIAEGPQAETLAEAILEWQWANFEADHLYEFLQGDARKIGEGNDPHTLMVGRIDRTVDEGEIDLKWVGTLGVRAYNLQRDIHPVEVGMYPGEAWSPAQGVYPKEARPHAQSFAVNTVDRLIIFSNPLRQAANELPFVGRATLQRIIETVAEHGIAYLLDIHPRQVVAPPSNVALNYRWESPTHVSLSWLGGDDASGFVIEEAPSPQFETKQIVAELTDHRQRVYVVNPPFDRDVYYRVVPINGNVRGEPSTPIIVTPVPLVPPQIEKINWSISGNLRVQWSDVPQADTYELEYSPSQDFDSAHTGVVYQGGALAFEIEKEDQPIGWYFRVRSRNSHYKPKAPSIWSNALRAPNKLETPTFKVVSPTLVTWTPVDGALKYEVRQKSEAGERLVAVTERNKFVPPELDAAYEVRAVRRENDDKTSSDWSGAVTVGGKSMTDFVIETTDPDEDSDTMPLVAITDDFDTRRGLGTRSLVVIAGVGLMTLLLGLVAGLASGPQLGIGIDPSDTPLSEAEILATSSQEIVNQDNAIARATLSSELNRMNIAATENAGQLSNLQTRNANLNQNNQNSVSSQETLSAEIEQIGATGTQISIIQGTVIADQNRLLDELEATNESASIGQMTVEAEMDEMEAQATEHAQQEATLNAEVEQLSSTIEAVPTATPTPVPVPRFGWLPAWF